MGGGGGGGWGGGGEEEEEERKLKRRKKKKRKKKNSMRAIHILRGLEWQASGYSSVHYTYTGSLLHRTDKSHLVI